ncbi:type II secretion system F family protein [Asanoa sp. WMMD1127]|uniref:type II secretion system F family protein n=1 Tax=Asanoa sp. WMMD1127 TaxID=3016107 RepID=UPI0024175CD4|nr:type II secretion system F family protein [Asanoa sp. WMMD1127]MDG4823928.1 type II secretion system F family protein [Asanoa sp. WMMD1127]
MLLLVGVVAIAAAIAVVGVTLTAGNPHEAVTRTIDTADRGYRVAGVEAVNPAAGVSLPPAAYALGQALGRGGVSAWLARRLDQAGNPAWLSVPKVIAYQGLLVVVGAAVAFALAVLFATPLTWPVWALVGAAAGYAAPALLVLHLAQERQELLRRTLPDVLDTLVVTVEAGLGFEAALAQVVRNGRGPMVGEFARVLHEMQIGRSRVDALREMAARTNVTELRAFASAVVQATTLGIPMGKVLRQQSAEMRVRRRQRAEELAQKVPVKILFPMIFCIFPALFVVVIGPAAIKILQAFGG